MEQKDIDQLKKVTQSTTSLWIQKIVYSLMVLTSSSVIFVGAWLYELKIVMVGCALHGFSNLLLMLNHTMKTVSLISHAVVELLEKEKTAETLND